MIIPRMVLGRRIELSVDLVGQEGIGLRLMTTPQEAATIPLDTVLVGRNPSGEVMQLRVVDRNAEHGWLYVIPAIELDIN